MAQLKVMKFLLMQVYESLYPAQWSRLLFAVSYMT